MEALFEINNLVCSYNGKVDAAVLEIKNLKIPRGEVVFLLGASGTGKSTLLEALGLMNNTMVSGNIVLNLKNVSNPSYAALWKEREVKNRSEVRKSCFSFIFQSTNLMDNFSVYENICLSSMIQKDVTQSEAQGGAAFLMNRMGMPVELVPTNALAKSLSVGQRQRVAFARALNSNPQVLFGDEPTGNLDEKNANELMRMIRDHMEDSATAIIVSHDINLALNHADRIICFERLNRSSPSTITDRDVFERKEWEDLEGPEKTAFVDKLRGFYHIETVSEISGRIIESDSDTNNRYRELFLKKEGRALLGAGYANLLRLIGILTLTFLAIGFANGSMNYLNLKLNDPFVNWLTINIPSSRSGDMNGILSQLNQSEVKERYLISSVVSFTKQPLFFYVKDLSKRQIANGRSVAVSADYIDPIMNDILAEKNLVAGNTGGIRGEKDLSLVVTERFMSNLGYRPENPIVYLSVPLVKQDASGFESVMLPIGVRAVVKEMPGTADVVYGEYFIRALNQTNDGPFEIADKKDIKLIIFGDSLLANNVLKGIKEFLSSSTRYRDIEPQATNYSKNYDTYRTAYEITIDFFPIPDDHQRLDEIYRDLMASEQMSVYRDQMIRYYNYHGYDGTISTPIHYDMISANFQKLDEVRNFGRYMLSAHNDETHIQAGNAIEVDLAKIREKENFNFLSTIAWIISVLVLVFGFVSVSMFVFNLLRNHLSKIKMNIGTFTAFGLSNKESQSIYFQITLYFILAALAASFVFSILTGAFMERVLSQYFVFEDNVPYFKLFDPFTLISIVGFIITGSTVSWFTIHKMLNKTPGELIYDR